MMTCLVVNYYNIKKSVGVADNVGLLLGMFVTIMFSARISGSHFNPCITFGFMFGNVKQMKFDRVLGVLYIAAQVAGGLLGNIFAAIFAKGVEGNIELYVKSDNIIQQCILEGMGSFFLVFMYLSSTEEKTKFTKDAAVQTIILAGSYLGAMLLAGSKIDNLKASPVNPAIALGIFIFNTSEDIWISFWIFLGISFGGSLLALIFFRKVYQATIEAVDQMEEEEEENN